MPKPAVAERPSTEEIPYSQELLRKATHLGALIIPSGYYFLGLDKLGMLAVMVPVTLFVLLIDFSRLHNWPLWTKFAAKFWGGMIRNHEAAGGLTGASYILMSVCLSVLIFSKPIAVCALSFIIVGDTFAAIVGRQFGKHRFRNKSVEGTIGCLVGTLIVAFIAPDLPLQIKLVGAVVAALVEAAPIRLDDNITVPIASGIVMTLLYNAITGF